MDDEGLNETILEYFLFSKSDIVKLHRQLFTHGRQSSDVVEGSKRLVHIYTAFHMYQITVQHDRNTKAEHVVKIPKNNKVCTYLV